MTTTSHKLPRVTKLAYGAGDLGAAITAAVTGFYLNAFLLDVSGLRPGLVGLIFLISTLWDAVTDPVVGNLTDRTRSRWGRRRPWLLYGSIPFGFAFFLHWLVPPFGTAGLFAYYLLVALLLKTAFTAVNVPYTALTPELTNDYDERTSLTAYRFSFSIVGGVLAVALHPVIVGLFGDAVLMGYAISAAVWAVFIAASSLVTFRFTEEQPRPDATDEKRYGFFEGMRLALQNRPFVYVTGIYLLSWLVIQLVQTNLLLYVRYWIDAESSFTIFVLILQFTAFGFLSVWSGLSERIGKKRVYYIGATMWAITLFAVYFAQPGQVVFMGVVSFFAGAGVSVGYLIPWSMLPDVVELDELKTGQRREGVYYGFFVFLQKLGLSLGLALSGFVLEWAGYLNPEDIGAAVEQPDSVLTVLRLFVSILPAILLLLSIPLAMAYPITPQRFDEIRAELAQTKTE